MAYINERLPELISFGVKGGFGFQTDVVIYGSGSEARNRNWSKARGRWDLAHKARLPIVWEPLQAFFHVAGGRANSFRFKDWFDYSVTSTTGKFITIDGSHKQLAKCFTFGSQTYYHPIYKPVSGTVTIASGTIDYTTGIVTGGAATSWTGQFDKIVRFDTDEMTGEILDKSGGSFVVGWDAIPVIETRLET